MPNLNHEAKRTAEQLSVFVEALKDGQPLDPQMLTEMLDSLASFLACCAERLPAERGESDSLPDVIGGLISNLNADITRAVLRAVTPKERQP